MFKSRQEFEETLVKAVEADLEKSKMVKIKYPQHPDYHVGELKDSEHGYRRGYGDKVVQFSGSFKNPNNKDDAYDHIKRVDAHMAAHGYHPIDRDDNSDIHDLLATTHYRHKSVMKKTESLEKNRYTARLADGGKELDDHAHYHIHDKHGDHVATVTGRLDGEVGLLDPDFTSGTHKPSNLHQKAAISAATQAAWKHPKVAPFRSKQEKMRSEWLVREKARREALRTPPKEGKE